MHWPWQKPPQPTSNIEAILERARSVRERADEVAELLLPAIDPNEIFASEPVLARVKEDPPWNA